MDRLPDPASWRALRHRQEGAVSRDQLLAQGISKATMKAHVDAGRWQRPIPGIYVTFSGPMPPDTRWWVALLHAGQDAVLSHETAGALWGLRRFGPGEPVHVSVPKRRAPRSRRGLIVHRITRPLAGVGRPPRTNVCETTLLLCQRARRPAEVTALLGRVAQRYPGAFTEVRAAAVSRRNLRWRREILAAAQDVAGGAHSELERRHLLDVERAHGLPSGVRQRAADRTRQDVHYKGYRTVVELDGRAVHEPVDAAWRDMRRDNRAAERGEVTLRYGWYDVRHRPCEVAAQIANVLRTNGWAGHLRSCGPSCALSGRL